MFKEVIEYDYRKKLVKLKAFGEKSNPDVKTLFYSASRDSAISFRLHFSEVRSLSYRHNREYHLEVF
jgi:hypothetical protein